MSVTSLAVVVVTIENALAGLEAESGWQPNALLAGTLARRRHSLRMLRRALTDADIAALRSQAAAARVRAAAPGDLGSLLLGEERLAAMLDGWIETLHPQHPHRSLALHLRAETDDAARVLRRMIASGA